VLAINNEATLDDFAALLTLESAFGGRLTYVVANNSVVAQFKPLRERGGSQTAEWGSEIVLTPQASFIDKISAARFRSAIAGSPGRVIAQLSEPGDILPASGTPFTQTLAASGAATTTGIGAVQLISDQLLTVAAAEVSFANIAQTFAHLRLLLSGRGDNATPEVAVYLQFNGDTAANYDTEVMAAAAASPSSAESLGVTVLRVGRFAAGTAPASAQGSITVDIPNYAATTFHKGIVSASADRNSAVSGGLIWEADAGSWRSTAAINRIRIIVLAGNFIAGSRFTLYGLAV
jgi:hypothetical protein